MPDYLLDTNHVTHLLGGAETLRRQGEATAATGQKFGVAIGNLTVENWLA